MAPIKSIECIIHPLFELDRRPKETFGLLERIKDYTRKKGRDPLRVFALIMNNPDDYDRPGSKFLDKSWANYTDLLNAFFRYGSDLIEFLNRSCMHLYGDRLSTGGVGKGRPDLMSNFKRFLRERELEINPHIEIIGHGTSRSACVTNSCNVLANSIENSLGLPELYFEDNDKVRINEETSLE
jgi:hypothetical protein